MIVLPADHFIGDERTFQKLIRFACRLASDDFLVTLGITPFILTPVMDIFTMENPTKRKKKWKHLKF